MAGYCGKGERYYDENGLDHMDNCQGHKPRVISGSLEDYHQQTGDTGLVQVPDGFDWDEALAHRDRHR